MSTQLMERAIASEHKLLCEFTLDIKDVKGSIRTITYVVASVSEHSISYVLIEKGGRGYGKI